ncbi:hypothetical protein [Streptomyces lasiicapitis]|uniref:hypothetical protein n=1 Tax=Streptomyces lasiicapitis TaxID=1923961 RepID=UPI0036CF9227
MNVHEKETSEVTAVAMTSVASVASGGATAWQTPEYTVVVTSLVGAGFRRADR